MVTDSDSHSSWNSWIIVELEPTHEKTSSFVLVSESAKITLATLDWILLSLFRFQKGDSLRRFVQQAMFTTMFRMVNFVHALFCEGEGGRMPICVWFCFHNRGMRCTTYSPTWGNIRFQRSTAPWWSEINDAFWNPLPVLILPYTSYSQFSAPTDGALRNFCCFYSLFSVVCRDIVKPSTAVRMSSGLSPVWKFSVILFAVIAVIALLLAAYGVHTALGRIVKLKKRQKQKKKKQRKKNKYRRGITALPTDNSQRLL